MELDDDDDNYVIRDSDARPIRSRSIFRLSSSIFSCTSGSFSSVVAALRSLHLLSEDRNLAVVRVDPLGDNQLLAFRRGDVRPDGDLRLHLLPSHDLVTQLDLQLFPISLELPLQLVVLSLLQHEFRTTSTAPVHAAVRSSSSKSGREVEVAVELVSVVNALTLCREHRFRV